MEKEKIGVKDRIGMRGLQNKGLIEISQDTKSGDYVLIIGKGIERKGPFNLPGEMWRIRCTKEEVPGVIKDFLAGL